jgi:putative hemolysin
MNDIAAQFSFASPDDKPLRRLMIRSIERLTGQRDFVSLYRQNRENPVPGENFFEAALRLLRLELAGDLTRLDIVPRSGPVIFVANHPYGVLDGIAACVLAGRARPDFRILISAMLVGPEEMKPYSLPIDFAETPEALRNNLRTRADARRHLASGGSLLLFPGGTVSTRISPFHRGPAGDPAWKPFVVQLAQRSGAAIVPLFFEGENSWMFHAASHLSVTLRLALLFREVHARMGTAIGVKIGDPIAASSLNGVGGRFDAAQQLRALTYAIGGMTPPRQYGPRLSRRLSLDVPEEWASVDALGRLKAAY